MGRCLLGAVVLALLPVQALAQGGRHYALFEYASGGDKIVTPDSGGSMRAGELLQIAYGYRFSSAELPNWHVDLRAGAKFAWVDVDGGDGVFYRFPLEMAFHRSVGESFRFGFGAAYHVFPSFRLDAGDVDNDIDFEDAFGAFVHLEFQVNEPVAIGLRYLQIDYKKDDATFRLPNGDIEDEVDGNSLGGYLTYTF